MYSVVEHKVKEMKFNTQLIGVSEREKGSKNQVIVNIKEIREDFFRKMGHMSF